MNRTALILAAVAVTFMIVSNTVGDGNTLGGIAFFIWALAVLALVGLGVKAVVRRA